MPLDPAGEGADNVIEAAGNGKIAVAAEKNARQRVTHRSADQVHRHAGFAGKLAGKLHRHQIFQLLQIHIAYGLFVYFSVALA